eukprot:3721209-Alexandrium_andersonii.AAC.1
MELYSVASESPLRTPLGKRHPPRATRSLVVGSPVALGCGARSISGEGERLGTRFRQTLSRAICAR